MVLSHLLIGPGGPQGDPRSTQYKSYYRHVLQIWVAKSASWYISISPREMQNLVYEWVDFLNFPKFEPKFTKIDLQKSGNFGQN